MAPRLDRTDRRRVLQAMAMSAAWWSVPGAFAQQLVPTAPQTEGPFYPDHLPLDTDNDLIVINDAVTPAVGAVTLLSGRILTASGQPVRNALVEIWQVDNNGVYIHSGSNDRKKHDTNFQGFGRFLTGSSGEYLFRTIKPVPYPGRTPHIHFAIKTKGREKFTTQCYIQGEAQNERDGVLRAVKDPKAKATLIVPFTPMPGSAIGELTAKFDVVLGFTPNV
jgi:protocatechuate 3,4-dioxygenase beta subunit